MEKCPKKNHIFDYRCEQFKVDLLKKGKGAHEAQTTGG